MMKHESNKRRLFLFSSLILILLLLFFFLTGYLKTTPARLIGAAFCHQIVERSPGHDFPFCYRCSGIFLGIISGIAVCLLSKKTEGLSGIKELLLFLISALLFVLDALNSSTYLNSFLYKDQVYTRFLSAFPMGFMLGLIVIRIAFYLFKVDIPAAQYRNISVIALFPFFFAAAFIMLFSSNHFIYRILSVFSCAAALGILSILYAILLKAVGLLLNKNLRTGSAVLTGIILAAAQICAFGGTHLLLKSHFGLIF